MDKIDEKRYSAILTGLSDNQEFSQVSNDWKLAKTALLKEAVLSLDPAQANRAVLNLKGFDHYEDELHGVDILNTLLCTMSDDKCLDKDWLLLHWDKLSALADNQAKTEAYFIGSTLTGLLKEQGFSIRQEAEYVEYDTWNFLLKDEQGNVIDWEGLYDWEDFPNFDKQYQGGPSVLHITDHNGDLCIQMPYTEYSFLTAYAAQLNSIGATTTGWNFENLCIRAGATNGFVLLHYPEYIAFLKEKGWTEIDRPESFHQAVEALWNNGQPLASLMEVATCERLRPMEAVNHCMNWLRQPVQQQEVSRSAEQKRNRGVKM